MVGNWLGPRNELMTTCSACIYLQQMQLMLTGCPSGILPSAPVGTPNRGAREGYDKMRFVPSQLDLAASMKGHIAHVQSPTSAPPSGRQDGPCPSSSARTSSSEWRIRFSVGESRTNWPPLGLSEEKATEWTARVCPFSTRRHVTAQGDVWKMPLTCPGRWWYSPT